MKNVKSMIGSLGIVCVMLLVSISPNVVNAEVQSPIAFLAVLDEDANVLDAKPGVCVLNDESAFVYVAPLLVNTYEASGFFTDNGVYQVIYDDELGALSCWEVYDFDITQMKKDPSVHEADLGVQGQSVSLYYDDDYDLETIQVMSTTLLEFDQNGVFTLSDYPSNALYPAVLLDQYDNCVGILFEEGVAACPWGDVEYFYSGTTQPKQTEEPEPQPTQQTNTTDPTATPKPTQQTNTTDPTATPKPTIIGTGGLFKDIISGAMIGGLALIVVGAITVITKKRKKTVQPVPLPKPPVPQDVDHIGETEDANVHVSTQKGWLVAKGGYMDGRVYPIEKVVITIGRAPSNNLRYPNDTPGISSFHAKIYLQDGKLYLMDSNSTHGTFVKRIGKIPPMMPVELESGDVIYLAEKTNSFEIKF